MQQLVEPAIGKDVRVLGERFQLGFTDQQKKDLVAFLKTP